MDPSPLRNAASTALAIDPSENFSTMDNVPRITKTGADLLNFSSLAFGSSSSVNISNTNSIGLMVIYGELGPAPKGVVMNRGWGYMAITNVQIQYGSLTINNNTTQGELIYQTNMYHAEGAEKRDDLLLLAGKEITDEQPAGTTNRFYIPLLNIFSNASGISQQGNFPIAGLNSTMTITLQTGPLTNFAGGYAVTQKADLLTGNPIIPFGNQFLKLGLAMKRVEYNPRIDTKNFTYDCKIYSMFSSAINTASDGSFLTNLQNTIKGPLYSIFIGCVKNSNLSTIGDPNTSVNRLKYDPINALVVQSGSTQVVKNTDNENYAFNLVNGFGGYGMHIVTKDESIAQIYSPFKMVNEYRGMHIVQFTSKRTNINGSHYENTPSFDSQTFQVQGILPGKSTAYTMFYSYEYGALIKVDGGVPTLLT